MSTQTISHRKRRGIRFKGWWNINHARPKAHTWLVKTATRVSCDYALNPTAWEDVKFIAKRFNLSEYKKLKKSDAWKLWKYTHPTVDERRKRLIVTAHHFDSKIQELKSIKGELKGKTHHIHPLIFGINDEKTVDKV